LGIPMNTASAKIPLLLPVENQVRELDAKILLACVAARQGFSTIIGPRRRVEFHITSFPRSIYISKGLKSGNGSYFNILRKLGHEIIAWDEEALVHLPQDTYFSRRFSEKALKHVSRLLAWGQDNAELWQQFPKLPTGLPIDITGNPRGDLLRPDISIFYAKTVSELKKTYGKFLLVNTNFNQVNAFYPMQNLFQPVKRPGERPKLGNLSEGMNRAFAKGLWNHKQLIFNDFKRLIPQLEQTFPGYTIVVRPHPGENQEVYHRIAADCQRVRVTNKGNVVPWLMAAAAMLHNGCTTGVEAYLLGVPAISYRLTVNKEYDYAFHRLPNMMSHECFNSEQLRETLQQILVGQLGVPQGNEYRRTIDQYLASQTGTMACERIVDVLNEVAESMLESPKPSLKNRLKGRYMINRRRLRNKYRSLKPQSHKKPELAYHNYPGVSMEELHKRISRFQEVLSYKRKLWIEQVGRQIYRIHP
jgi:surface carbohydrate biosynthesis protein